MGDNPLEKRYAWIFKKRARVYARNDSDDVIDNLKFGTVLYVGIKPEAVNGRVYIQYKGRKYDGWVNESSITRKHVENYANLTYYNNTGKRVPVALKMCGKVCGFIPPGSAVKMVAKCGDWCLTSSGWTKFKWFTKDRNIDCDEGINLIYISVLKDAVDSYKRAVNKLINHANDMDDFIFCERVRRMEDLAEWILNDEYKLFSDGGDGTKNVEQKLDWINHELGIDRAWIKQKVLARKAIERKHRWKAKPRE